MRVSLNLSMNNSQPLRFGNRHDHNPSFQKMQAASQPKTIDYKKEYEKSQAQLDYMSKKYEVLCNVCALGLNPKFKA